jgi:hypothetical protein
MATRVRLGDWDTLTDELRRFGQGGEVTVGDDAIRVDLGSAHVEVSRDGRVSTGMPLHDFEREGEVTLAFDHEAGELTVEDETVSYTFRRPGG